MVEYKGYLYNGYLAPWTDEIVRRYKAGEHPIQIAGNLLQPVRAHYEKDSRWNGYLPFPTSTMITYVLRRVGAMPPPPPITVKFLGNKNRGEVYGPWLPPRILGRPRDMGGPRDVWLERSPWDEL